MVIPISLARLAAHTSATATVSQVICPAGVLLNEGTHLVTQLLNVTSIKVPRKEILQAQACCLN